MVDLSNRKDIFFITYDGLIKNFQPTLLDSLRVDVMKEKYGDILDIDFIKSLDKKQIEALCVASYFENTLTMFSKRNDVNFGALLLDLFNQFPDLFSESDLLPLGKSIPILLRQSFLEKIYIYTPLYDERIYEDIKNLFPDPKVVYVYGDFDEVLKDIPERITSYAINNINYVENIIKANKIFETELIIGKYGYNFVERDDGIIELALDLFKLQEDHTFKFVLHDPYPDSILNDEIILSDKQ